MMAADGAKEVFIFFLMIILFMVAVFNKMNKIYRIFIIIGCSQSVFEAFKELLFQM
jgi:hypothetical protein